MMENNKVKKFFYLNINGCKFKILKFIFLLMVLIPLNQVINYEIQANSEEVTRQQKALLNIEKKSLDDRAAQLNEKIGEFRIQLNYKMGIDLVDVITLSGPTDRKLERIRIEIDDVINKIWGASHKDHLNPLRSKLNVIEVELNKVKDYELGLQRVKGEIIRDLRKLKDLLEAEISKLRSMDSYPKGRRYVQYRQRANQLKQELDVLLKKNERLLTFLSKKTQESNQEGKGLKAHIKRDNASLRRISRKILNLLEEYEEVAERYNELPGAK